MRGKQATALAASTAAVPLPLSPIVKKLRQMWRFAAICQFLFTFDEAFGMSGFETEALERDLDGSETQMIPDLMRRLLYTLTLNREIDSSNWESYLRAQYEAREPKNLLLGTAESPLPWAALPLTAKVDTIYTLCEWQLVDAERFRKLVKNDEDAQIWRIDPIGWDGQDNTYWLFDDNRLWIQHPPPPEPVKARPPKKNSKKARAEAAAAKRAAQKAAEGPSTPKPSSVAKRKRDSLPTSSPKPRREPLRSSTRGKPVTEISAPTPSPQKRTRRSLRGDADGWEEIPPELLYEGQSGRREAAEKGASTTQNGRKANGDTKQRSKREGSTDSELSEPPSLDEKKDGEDVKMEDADADVKVDEAAPSIDTNGHQKAEEESPKIEEEEQSKEEEEKPVKEEEKPEWIEFEAIAVTRPEWEAFATKFAKSKHPDEKALHALLSDTVIPKVMRDIAEVEKQRAHEAAMASRKRSSRIALKESEKEERERDRAARLAMEERMASLRREEQDKANREEEERKAVKHREDRLREREERILAREREAEEKALREIQEREERERMREIRKQRREEIIANGGVPTPEPAPGPSAQGSEAQDGDSWELDCEVCGKAGINLDDTDEIVCCERCGVWQHTECWNAFDRSVHHPRRDWEKEDFFCSKCRPPAPGQPWPQRPQRLPQAPSVPSQRPAVPSQAHPPYAQQQYMPTHNVQHPQQQQQQQQQQRYGYPPQQAQPMPMQQQALQPSHVRPQQQHLYQHPQQMHAHPPPQPQQQYLQQQYQQYQQNQHFQPQVQHQQRPQGQQSPVPAAQGHQSYPSSSAFATSRPPQDLYSGPSHGSAAPSAPPAARPVPAAAPPRPQPAAAPAPPALNGAAHSSAAAVPRPAQASPISSPSAAVPARPATQASPLTSNQTPISASSPVAQKPAPSTPGSAQEQRSSPGTTNGSSSMAAPTSSPLKSPSAKPFVHRASQPSGSFPLRHTPAKSPLSGGHAPSPPVTGTANAPIPAISLGPARATSPSPGPKGAGTATLGSTPPISQQARDPNSLYSRQTPSSTTSTPGSQTSTGHGDGRAPTYVQGPPSGPGPGPGPASGSLVRPDQDRRTVGPSLPRGPFGSTAPSQTSPGQASSQPPVEPKLNQAPTQPAAAVAQQQQQQQQQQAPVSGPPSSTAQQPHQM